MTRKRPPARVYPERPKPPSGEVVADLIKRGVIKDDCVAV